MTSSETITAENTTHEITNYGGVVDAIGGAATVVLAIIGLAGTNADILLSIATIVFGAALLIQSGTILSELANVMFPNGTSERTDEFSAAGVSVVFLVGVAGIVLGILALIGLYPPILTSIAVITFGAALVFGSNSVWSVHRMKRLASRGGGQGEAMAGGEILAAEVAAGSAALQCIAGLAALVLGILAVTGTYPAILSLVGLLVMGSAILLTGSTLSGVVQAFMRPTSGASREGGSWTRSAAE
jgi:hypothetical protein